MVLGVEFFDFVDVRLAVSRWPARDTVAPPVVLLPAMGETSSDWDRVADSLCRDREVLAVDLRGHGASGWPGVYSIELMAEDVRRLLDVLGFAAVDLIGHSLGALVACRVAAARPVRRLVLEDIGLPYPRKPELPTRPSGELEFDWQLVEQVRPEIDSPAADWVSTISGIRSPTLVISGGEASFVPHDRVEALANTLIDGSMAVIEVGHDIHAAAPEPFLQVVRTFLDERPQSAN